MIKLDTAIDCFVPSSGKRGRVRGQERHHPPGHLLALPSANLAFNLSLSSLFLGAVRRRYIDLAGQSSHHVCIYVCEYDNIAC